MTNINPTYQKPAIQNIETLLDALKEEMFKELNCCKVGVIQSFDAATLQATVEVAFTQVTSIAPDGTQTLAPYPLLLNVPVHFQQGGNTIHTFPITAGDECLVLFNDRQIDNWLATGAGQPPSIGRTHDLSDGIAIVGVRNNTRPVGGVSTTTTQLRSIDGNTYVEVDATGGIVNVVAPTSINLTAPQVNITASTGVLVDTPAETITGTINVENTASSATPCTITGAIQATGDIVAGEGSSNVSLLSHVHSGVTTGGGDTGGPV